MSASLLEAQNGTHFGSTECMTRSLRGGGIPSHQLPCHVWMTYCGREPSATMDKSSTAGDSFLVPASGSWAAMGFRTTQRMVYMDMH